MNVKPVMNEEKQKSKIDFDLMKQTLKQNIDIDN